MKRVYGWKPDLPDHRDLRMRLEAPVILPPKVDLRVPGPVLFDQGQLGSCTANAISSAFQYELVKQKAALITPSRLFLYYNERKAEGTVKQDAGAQIRDGFKVMASYGLCQEADWPYVIQKFASKPPKRAYSSALSHQSLQYFRLDNSQSGQLKQCLAAGYPFVFGFTVYDSFESEEVAKTGIVPMPNQSEDPLGGHAALCVGYDDEPRRFLVQNSWREGWGQAGFFTIPYEYLTNSNLADDFWTLRLVEG